MQVESEKSSNPPLADAQKADAVDTVYVAML